MRPAIHDGPGTHRHVKIITITNTTFRGIQRGGYMYRIEADLLIPGRGDPIRDGVVLLDGSRVAYAGPAGVAPATVEAPVTQAAAVMPGMWDCHGHLLGTRSFDLGKLPLEPESL